MGAHDLICFDLGDYPLNLDEAAKHRVVDVLRAVQPSFILTHSKYDPYNTDHMATMAFTMEARMIAQAWGHNPGENGAGRAADVPVRAAPDRADGWAPKLFLDITSVWDKKRAAIECMEGQHHLWAYYTNVAENRGNHFRRNSGGMAGGRDCKYAEGFQAVFPRCVDELS